MKKVGMRDMYKRAHDCLNENFDCTQCIWYDPARLYNHCTLWSDAGVWRGKPKKVGEEENE